VKSANRFSIKARNIWTGFLLLGFIAISAGQEKQAGSQNGNEAADRTKKEYAVRIAVEEVRLDVVVLDKKGHQIPNLTDKDFMIFQDGLLMEIRSCTYITDQANPSEQTVISRPASKAAPGIVTPPLAREQVRRVIAFVVDDLSMTFEQVYRMRTSLRKFVEKQMQPGDLVAILRTGRGNSALQMFLSDKRELLARIETIRWGANLGADIDPYNTDRIYGGQLSTIRYCIRALQDVPGRKALVMMTSQTTLPTSLPSNPPDYYGRYRNQYNKLADEAMRAGVVVHMLDSRGLEAPFPDPSAFGGGSTIDDILNRYGQFRIPLAQKTGGLDIQDSNFSAGGIKEVNNALLGYYLLSYAPPPNTFKSDQQAIYHRINVKVRRQGVSVHTRDGFYGTTAPAPELSQSPNALRDAIFSPFLFSDLKVHLASGYVENPNAGYLVQSWLHLNLNELNMQKETEGYLVKLETVSVATDSAGVLQDSSLMHYQFRIQEGNLAFIRDHGMRFSLALPIKKPGAYYIRVAVKDEISGKIGSAYQFVDIPNLRARRLALSNLFFINGEADLALIQPELTRNTSQRWLVPNTKRDEGKSPAIRRYRPGESIEYLSVVYNAKQDKDAPPDLEPSFVLYKDGKEIMKGQPQTVDLKSINNWDGIPIKGKLVLENTQREGDYVLQLLVKDNRAGKKKNLASQALDFSIFKSAH
jgi:VWFA-related protein